MFHNVLYCPTEILAGRSVRGLQVRLRHKSGNILRGQVNGERILSQREPCALSVMNDNAAGHRYLQQIEHQHALFDAVFRAVYGYPLSNIFGERVAQLYANAEDDERPSRE